MTRTRILAAIALVLLPLGGSALMIATHQDAFPHDRHARMFPFCEGCHDTSGARAALFPATSLCARCHDGEQAARVEWSAPAVRPSLLRFDHARHAVAADTVPGMGCATCHAAAERIARSDPAICLQCHSHQAREHFEDAACTRCHVPIARSGAPDELTLAMSAPAGHAADSFLARHGGDVESQGATCQFCHVRQQCAACHVDAGSVPAIATLETGPPALHLASVEPRYPKPVSHEATDFLESHGRATTSASCSTCHTKESCSTCHVAPAVPAIDALPSRTVSAAPGVELKRKQPMTHLAPDFASAHGTLAASDDASCMTCHTASTCEECHSAPARASFHPPAFELGHAATAWAGRLECTNCHDRQAFCRTCHDRSGVSTPGGRLQSTAWHDAEPLWLIRHGGAARRALESCTTCHAQRDCLQCHSTFGAFRVSPHGPDFDARRAQKSNPIICKACHLSDPIRSE